TAFEPPKPEPNSATSGSRTQGASKKRKGTSASNSVPKDQSTVASTVPEQPDDWDAVNQRNISGFLPIYRCATP
ncbi:hypothetical protein FRC08_017698, partial [Ceratobasidium sp. 394]